MANVFGLEKPTFFLAKSDIFNPECTEEGEGGGSNGLGNTPKNTIFLFFIGESKSFRTHIKHKTT